MREIILQHRHERDYLAAKSYQQRYVNIPVKEYLQSPLIKVVSGARRAGKSVFCLQMLQGTNYAYLNFDDSKLLQGFDEDTVTQLLQEVYPGYEYLMLDEIQNLDGWELWIEKLYRRGTNLILTGSNAKLLSSELSTVLSGRYLKIEILPFSLEEDLSYLGVPREWETPEQRGVFMHDVDDYMQYGGYAEVVKSRSLTQTYLQGVYDTVLLKDIIQRYKIHNTDDLYNVAEWLVSNVTGLFTVSSLAEELGMSSKTTLQKYCDYLSSSYLYYYLPRFNNKLQLMKKAARKSYMVDTGFVKAKAFGVSQDLGKLLENMVFVELLRRGYEIGKTLFYYRSRNDKEVDFVLRKGNKVVELVQVCYDMSSPKTERREVTSLLECAEELRCNNCRIITWDEERVVEEGEGIEVVPFWKWAVRDAMWCMV